MMTIQIRLFFHETNSSSTHAIVVCMGEDFGKWKRGELLLNSGGHAWSSTSAYKSKRFVTVEEAIDILTNNKYPPSENLAELSPDDLLAYLADTDNDSGFSTYESYFNDNELETFEETFRTPGGEVVIAFGMYGMDG